MGYRSSGSEIEKIFNTRIMPDGGLLRGRLTLMGFLTEEHLRPVKKEVYITHVGPSKREAQMDKAFGKRIRFLNTGNERIVNN